MQEKLLKSGSFTVVRLDGIAYKWNPTEDIPCLTAPCDKCGVSLEVRPKWI